MSTNTSMRRWSLAVLLCALLPLGVAACGAKEETNVTSEPWPSEAERTMEEGQAPTPFTADQIRDACGRGRRSTYRMEVVGMEPFLQTFHFLYADEFGASFEVAMTDLEGNGKGQAQRLQSRWTDFQSHAAWPAEATTITEESVEVPAGSYPCFRYRVEREKDGKPHVVEAWFARAVPGPPVKLIETLDGQVRQTMTLVEHVDGSA